MACDTQYSVMSTGSLYCLGISPHMLNADAFLFFPFFSFCGWYVDWIHDHRTHRHGGDSLRHSFLTSWPMSSAQVQFPGILSEDGAMLLSFPRASGCSLLSPLSHFLPQFDFYLTIHPHRFGYYVNPEGPKMSSLDRHWLQNQGTSHQDRHRAPLPVSGPTTVSIRVYLRSVVSCIHEY